MIKTFRHKGLKEVFETRRSRSVNPDLHSRFRRALDVLDNAVSLLEIAVPGYRVHLLKGTDRHAMSVSGPWRITFRWVKPDALEVDLEQYH